LHPQHPPTPTYRQAIEAKSLFDTQWAAAGLPPAPSAARSRPANPAAAGGRTSATAAGRSGGGGGGSTAKRRPKYAEDSEEEDEDDDDDDDGGYGAVQQQRKQPPPARTSGAGGGRGPKQPPATFADQVKAVLDVSWRPGALCFFGWWHGGGIGIDSLL